MIKKYSVGNQCEMMLVCAGTQKPLEVGTRYRTFRGETVLLRDGTPPHKPSSSGFITVSHMDETGSAFSAEKQEYYVGVIGAMWVPVNG